MTIWVFGDSLSLPHNLSTDTMAWPDILAKDLGHVCRNYAQPAADNLFIWHCYDQVRSNISIKDIVIVGWSHYSRKSFVYDSENQEHKQSIPRSIVYQMAGKQFMRSNNPPDDSLKKWLDFKPKFRQNPFYDIWFRDYYNDHEQRLNLVAYYHAVDQTCSGLYVPFFFNQHSVKGLDLTGAGYAMEFIQQNNCAISNTDHHFNANGHKLWTKVLYQYIQDSHDKTTWPIIELFDRWAIARIKSEMTNEANKHETLFYDKQINRYDLSQVQDLLTDLQKIHRQIWNLEKELKSGVEQNLSMDEIGRRAIEIRNHNNQRIKIKNLLAIKLDCCVQEIKQDHLSQ